MSTCIIVYYTDNYLFGKKLPPFQNHLLTIGKYFIVIIMKTLNSIEDKGFYSNIMYLYLPFKRLLVHDRILMN